MSVPHLSQGCQPVCAMQRSPCQFVLEQALLFSGGRRPRPKLMWQRRWLWGSWSGSRARSPLATAAMLSCSPSTETGPLLGYLPCPHPWYTLLSWPRLPECGAVCGNPALASEEGLRIPTQAPALIHPAPSAHISHGFCTGRQGGIAHDSVLKECQIVRSKAGAWEVERVSETRAPLYRKLIRDRQRLVDMTSSSCREAGLHRRYHSPERGLC